MKILEFKSFLELAKNEKIIKNYVIKVTPTDILYIDEYTELEIVNCIFENSDLIIKCNNSETKTHKFSIKDSTLEGVSIYNVQISNLYLSNLKVDYLDISSSVFLNLYIIAFININHRIKLNNVTTENITEILGNKFIDKGSISIFNSNLNNCDFIESTFNDVLLQSSIFKGRFDFYKNNLNHQSNRFLFDECVFEKANFSRTNLSKNTQFDNCKFIDVVLFNEVFAPESKVYYQDCLFEKYVQFNHAIINELEIDSCQFYATASFQNIKIETIIIDRTVFEKTHYLMI